MLDHIDKQNISDAIQKELVALKDQILDKDSSFGTRSICLDKYSSLLVTMTKVRCMEEENNG